MPCPVCRGTLFIRFEAESITFQCPEGHASTIGDLLDSWAADQSAPSASDRRHWEQRGAALAEMAREARSVGSPRQASELQDAARRVQQRLHRG